MIKLIEGYSYKVNQNIGKGYSSIVHKGANDKTGEDVSIKVIQMSKLQDPINQMLLQYEVSALKALSFSTNVLHLYDVYATKNNTYIITQLMQGDIHTLLKQKKQFPYYQACQILKQIITGYIDIYNQGYLHRDIKPANIFYRQNQFKIGDFGFAIPIAQINEHKNYNVGSPVYMPPQALKQNAYSVSCDTWAIGIIFYQLLKGLVPWRAISEQKLYEKVISEPLNELTVGLPQAARTFLSRILHLDIHQRMKPQQLSSWPAKLFAVQIRPMNLSPLPPSRGALKVPLQQIQNKLEIYNRDYSRSKSYSSSQVPNHVSGLRLNLCGPQNQNQSNQAFILAPSTNHTIQNKYNNHSTFNSNINYTNSNNFFSNSSNNANNNSNYTSNNGSNYTNNHQKIYLLTLANNDNLSNLNNLNNNNQINSLNKNQQSKQKHSIQNKQINNNSNSNLTPLNYSQYMISYLKFIHRVIKFISSPTTIPLKDLQLSLIKLLFKQLESVKKQTEVQNTQHFTHGWKEFITSKQAQQNFINKLSTLKQKYKMFHILPKNQFVLQVYKEQLLDGIQKIATHLEDQNNHSDKTIVALDYLITFYQVWELKQKSGTKSFKEFLQLSKVDKIMEGNPYNVQRQHIHQLRKKMKVLGFINSYKDVKEIQPLTALANKYQDLSEIKVNYYERAMRY